MLFFSCGVQRFWLDTVRMCYKKSKRNGGCTVDYLKKGWREIIDNVRGRVQVKSRDYKVQIKVKEEKVIHSVCLAYFENKVLFLTSEWILRNIRVQFRVFV